MFQVTKQCAQPKDLQQDNMKTENTTIYVLRPIKDSDNLLESEPSEKHSHEGFEVQQPPKEKQASVATTVFTMTNSTDTMNQVHTCDQYRGVSL